MMSIISATTLVHFKISDHILYKTCTSKCLEILTKDKCILGIKLTNMVQRIRVIY